MGKVALEQRYPYRINQVRARTENRAGPNSIFETLQKVSQIKPRKNCGL